MSYAKKWSAAWLADELWPARLFRFRFGPWLRYRANRHTYRFVDEQELRAARRSDTVYVFGSGASLNDVTAPQWEAIARHDTIGFNWFVHQRFVRCDYHLIRGIPDSDRDPEVWRPQLAEYFELIASNPCFADTTFLVQTGFRAINGNRAIGYGLLPRDRPIFPWRTNSHYGSLPSRSFADGLVHGHSTIQECVNFAFLLGWKRIVLAGVDLYDRRYFWLDPETPRSLDEQRGADVRGAHDRAGSGIVAELERWGAFLAGEGVELSVLNPASLLARVLPVTEPA